MGAASPDLEAVTVDALGTCVELEDPTEALRAALARAGCARPREAVRAAFEAEAAYYVPRSHTGSDPASLAALRRRSVGVFLAAAGADVETGDFVGEFLASLRFRAVEGAAETLDALGSAGLRLACVANWDVSLPDALAAAGLEGRFHTVVSSAEAGAPKPDPAPFRLALGRLAVPADRALHIGDSAADRDGARAAGLAFATVPLATLPARLGIER